MPTEYTIEGEVSFDQLEAWVKQHEEADAAGLFVGRPLRAEARQSCYESQFRTIH